MIDSYVMWSAVSFVGLLIFSAFFSCSETALFSLTRAQIVELADDKRLTARTLEQLLNNPRRLLIILLSGNTIVNILAATVAALTTSRLLEGSAVKEWVIFLVQGIAVTLVLLITSEILPKFAAIRNPLVWAHRVARPLKLLSLPLYPITAILLPFSEFVAKSLGVEKRKLWISEEEIKTLVEVGEEHGALETSEREMIHSIFELGDITVREIMVPRTDMIALDISSLPDPVLDVIRRHGHSRIPVFDGKVDNIVGILHAKDLLAKYPFDEPFEIRALLRPAHFVPENKPIDELLRQFQNQRIHMVIVVDEHGGTSGIVTLEDVIEEIVGEIHDEHDADRPLWTRVDENTIIVDAKMDVESVNQLLEENVIPIEDDFDTLGGFILSELGDFPEVHTSLEFHNYEFIVEEIRHHRLGRIRVVKREALEENES